MRSRSKRIGFAATLTVGLAGLLASSAAASFHLTKIREVHNGGDAAHSYVMLQLPEANEGFLMNRYVSFRDATGMIQGDHVITVNAANMGSQRTFLVGGSAVPGSDSVGPTDQIVDPSGAACYEGSPAGMGGLDCVTWGAFTGSALPVSSAAGTPAPSIGTGQSLVRTIARGCPTALDAADDTDSSASDFSLGTPIGRPNSATPTEKLCGGTTPAAKKKCKKHKKKTGAYSAKKKKCKKKKH
jgi:hypothetical protein